MERTDCRMDGLSPRERRHEAILDAAEALFIEQGYDGTSLAEIVRRSGGSLATLYELFGNKQGLLHAIATRWRDRMEDEPAESGPAAPRSPAEMLTDYACRRCRTLNSPHTVALIRMLVSEGLRDRAFAVQVYRDMHLPAIEQLSDLFAGWTAAGQARIDDPRAAAEMFLSLIAGDSILSTLTGVAEGVLSEEQIAWRLRPFLSYFRIG
ncbi:MAG: TetR/AcrR family transcriptional regulator [Alphaproteobacteria bacterium HGW-Alphaproteobacteria-13]|nr:MAG: TetR/AcrR family transcriptional regulator [Alphaproteobacteria bacterium HGW-Alphaproteobacteria-13]